VKKQTGMRLSAGARFLADRVGLRMGNFDRTTVVELAILELAQSELQRGRLKPEDMEEYRQVAQDEREGK